MNNRIDLERDNEIVERRDNGWTFQLIGASMGLSRQRVHQIYNRAVKRQKPSRIIGVLDRLLSPLLRWLIREP